MNTKTHKKLERIFNFAKKNGFNLASNWYTSTVSDIFMNRSFWEAIGNGLGWYVHCSEHTKDLVLKDNAFMFHSINLDERGFSEAVKWLDDLIQYHEYFSTTKR